GRPPRRRAPWDRVTGVAERGGPRSPAVAGRSGIASGAANGAGAQVKPGRHREATLYGALAGAGASDGRTLDQLREAARSSYETLPLPVWRRSGFWTTSIEGLDLDALSAPPADRAAEGAGVLELVQRTLPDRAPAGRLVQSAGAVVQVELDPELQ